jgi:hypothetical protein
MNERIKNLAIDAWTEKSTDEQLTSEEWMVQYIDLFANKLLDECISAIELETVDLDKHGANIDGLRAAILIIKEHFQDAPG